MPPRGSQLWLYVAVFLLVSLTLYLRLFSFEGAPLMGGLDQAGFLHDAQRMADGRILYRDFDQFTFPGMSASYFLLIELLGMRAWIPNLVVLVAACTMVVLGLVIGRELFTGGYGCVPAVLFGLVILPNNLDGTHHLLSAMFSLAAVTVLLKTRDRWHLAASGVLCGFALWFTQSRGSLAILAILVFLYIERMFDREAGRVFLVKVSAFLAAAILTCACLTVPFVIMAGCKTFLKWTIWFPIQYYAGDWRWNSLAASVYWFYGIAGGQVRSIFFLKQALILLLIPWVYVAALAGFARRRWRLTNEVDRRILLITIAGTALFLSVAGSPWPVRMVFDGMFACTVLAWVVLQVGGRNDSARVMLLVCTVAILWSAVHVSHIAAAERKLELPTGQVVVVGAEAGKYWGTLQSLAKPGDYALDAPDYQIYFFLQLKSPSPAPYLSASRFTRPEEVEQTLEQMQRHQVSFVLWSADLDGNGAPDDSLGPLRAYIRKNFAFRGWLLGRELWVPAISR